MKKAEGRKVKKGINGDTCFGQLKDFICSLSNVKESNIARLAMIDPRNLSDNPQFHSNVKDCNLLDRIYRQAETIETS